MHVQIKGVRLIVRSAIGIANFVIFRHVLLVFGVHLTGAERWSRSNTTHIVLCVRSMESLLQMFHGLIPEVVLQKTLI